MIYIIHIHEIFLDLIMLWLFWGGFLFYLFIYFVLFVLFVFVSPLHLIKNIPIFFLASPWLKRHNENKFIKTQNTQV